MWNHIIDYCVKHKLAYSSEHFITKEANRDGEMELCREFLFMETEFKHIAEKKYSAK